MTPPNMPATTIDIMFGRISRSMIRQLPSPLTSAEETKSFSRSERVCERSTRAGQAQHGRPEAARQKRGEDDQERQAGDDQHHVREEREQVVDPAAEVAGGQT